METRLQFEIQRQPDDAACGPTCLHAVYRYYGGEMPLKQVIEETAQLQEGGTLAVLLACHALGCGFRATIYTYNLQVFDPTWFRLTPAQLPDRLKAQMEAKDSAKLHVASRGYLEFLQRGGKLIMEDLTASLIRRYLRRGVPILTGLSATYLYRDPREYGPRGDSDDIRGVPTGHFVVLCGYDSPSRSVLVADPRFPNPVASQQYYAVNVDRAICAVLLGILTYDANLLIIEPRHRPTRSGHADFDRGR